MNREIKFRIWDVENKEMLKVQELDFEPTFYGGRIAIRPDQYNDYFDTEDMILMQYTGLHDKNGKEIYEGDILKVPVRRCGNSYGNWWQDRNDNHGWTGDFVYKKIEFKNGYDNLSETIGGFVFKYLPITKKQIKAIAQPRGKERTEQNVDTYNFKIEEVQVIGNIYDNPELLGGE